MSTGVQHHLLNIIMPVNWRSNLQPVLIYIFRIGFVSFEVIPSAALSIGTSPADHCSSFFDFIF
jgi:hypothetical protein